MTTVIQLVTPSKEDAKKVIAGWEKEDGYYTTMNACIAGKINRIARRYPYLESSENMATTVTRTLNLGVPLSTSESYDLVYLDGRSDAGLPHTRGLHGIALPIFLLWNPLNAEKTLRHEFVHLSQKQFPQRWWSWYQREWNFRKCTPDEFMTIPEKWRARRRINPDTLGSPYTIWKDRYIPLSVFLSDLAPDLKECKRGFWDIKISQWTWEPPPDWIATFGTGFNDEHPNEIAAHWLTDGPSQGDKHQEYFSLRPV